MIRIARVDAVGYKERSCHLHPALPYGVGMSP
jgi:hypothetical protein